MLFRSGVPTGGTAGQLLSKINSTDYNTQWVNAPATNPLSNSAFGAILMMETY